VTEVQGPKIVYTVDIDDPQKKVVDFVKSSEANMTKLAKTAAREMDRIMKSVDKMAAELKGSGATQNLDLIDKALTKAGGASKLTEFQFDKLALKVQNLAAAGGKLTPQLAQMVRGMDEAKVHAQAMDKAMEEALSMNGAKAGPGLGSAVSAEAMNGLQGMAGRLGPVGAVMAALGPAGLVAAAGIAAIGGAAIAAAKTVFDLTMAAVGYGNSLKDLEAQTGITVENLQRLKYAAGVSGTSFDSVTDGVVKLQQALIESPDKFAALGIEVEKFKNLRPEEQLAMVARAISSIEDPAIRNAAAIDLMGKKASELMPFLTGGFTELADQAGAAGAVLDSNTVEALARTQTAVNRLTEAWAAFTTGIGAMVGKSPAVLNFLNDAAVAVSEVGRRFKEQGFVGTLAQTFNEATGRAPVEAGGAPQLMGPPRPTAADAELQKIDEERLRKSLDSKAKAEEEARKKAAAESNKKAEEIERKRNEEYARTMLQVNQKEQADAAERARKFEADKLKTQEKIIADGAAKGAAMLDALAKKTIEDAKKRTEEQARTFKGTLKSAFADLPQTILGAIQGGGNVLAAIGSSLGASIFNKDSNLTKSITSGLSKLFGESIGKSLGAVLPGIGALAGPLLGKIGGFIGGLFGGGEAKKVKEARANFIAAAGGIHELAKKAGEARVPLDKLFNARNVKDYEAAVRDVQKALDTRAQALEELKAAQEEFGLTDAEMGADHQKRTSDETAISLLKKFELLKAGGADVNAVMSKMAPTVNEWLQAAVAAGTAIPEAMRPMLQSMLDAGVLTDETGVKLENLDNVTWSETLEEGLRGLIETLNALVVALGGVSSVKLPPIQVPVEQMPVNTGGANGPPPGYTAGGAAGGANAPPQYAQGTNYVPNDGLAYLHRGEAVIPAGYNFDLPRMASPSSDDGARPGRERAELVHVHVHVANQEMASAIVRLDRGGFLTERG
jgi:hypothetical protein